MKTIRGFVDGVHEGIARVLLGEDESVIAEMPVGWLPEETREGDVLIWSCQVDRQAGETSKKGTESLMEELGDNP